MLGINVADAVAIGTLLTLVYAAWRGMIDGAAAKASSPSNTAFTIIASKSMVDAFVDLADAVRELTATLNTGIETQEQQMRREQYELMHRIASLLEDQKKP